MQKIIDAEKSDLFDVLAHVSYALPTRTRAERARDAKRAIRAHFGTPQQAFLDFVLGAPPVASAASAENARLVGTHGAPYNNYWYFRRVLPMSKNTSVALGDHFTTFVNRQVEDGRYGNASEVIRAGLRLLEEHEAKHKALQAAIQEGIDSGPPQAIDLKSFVRRKKAGSRRG